MLVTARVTVKEVLLLRTKVLYGKSRDDQWDHIAKSRPENVWYMIKGKRSLTMILDIEVPDHRRRES